MNIYYKFGVKYIVNCIFFNVGLYFGIVKIDNWRFYDFKLGLFECNIGFY